MFPGFNEFISGKCIPPRNFSTQRRQVTVDMSFTLLFLLSSLPTGCVIQICWQYRQWDGFTIPHARLLCTAKFLPFVKRFVFFLLHHNF